MNVRYWGLSGHDGHIGDWRVTHHAAVPVVLSTARIIQVDVFNSQGELPRNLSQVSERAKDIQYASRTRFNIEQMQEVGELRATCRRLVGKLPAALKSDPDAIKLAAACSRATITEAWTAGLEDVRRSVSGWDKLRPAAGRHGVVVYRPTEDLPPSGPVAIPVKG